MVGFAFALALDANEIQVEKHIEHFQDTENLILSDNYQSSSSSHMAGFAFALALDANEIQIEKHIELCYSPSRCRESHLTTTKAVHFHLWLVLHLRYK